MMPGSPEKTARAREIFRFPELSLVAAIPTWKTAIDIHASPISVELIIFL